MKVTLEVRSAEGGDDAKLFAKDLAAAYVRLFSRFGWKHRLLDSRAGEISYEVIGEDLTGLKAEAGGHRIMRVPPTERKGRVHTSTVTVAVLSEAQRKAVEFNDRDFRIEWYSGTGAGGQHRNKHQNSCRIVHTSGVVATAQCRSRENSLNEAKAAILARLNGTEQAEQARARSVDRKEQTGSGERGDKIRTYRFQDNQVKDHRNNATAPIDQILDGKFNLLW